MKCNKTLLFLIGCMVLFLLVGAVSATDKNNQTVNNTNIENNTTEIDNICQNNSSINPQCPDDIIFKNISTEPLYGGNPLIFNNNNPVNYDAINNDINNTLNNSNITNNNTNNTLNNSNITNNNTNFTFDDYLNKFFKILDDNNINFTTIISKFRVSLVPRPMFPLFPLPFLFTSISYFTPFPNNPKDYDIREFGIQVL